MDFELRPHTHLLTVAGSRAYGMHGPGSDVDLKGVAIPPREHYLGLRNPFQQADKTSQIAIFLEDLSPEEQTVSAKTKLEGSVYDLRKFCNLALDCNPHVLDALFCRDEEVRICTPIGRALREAAPLVLSTRARFSFAGYAASQLKRIETHRKWLLEPPTHQPTRAEFDLPEVASLPRDELNAANAAIQKQLDSWELDLSGLRPTQILAVEERLTEMMSHSDRFVAASRAVGLHEGFILRMQQERAYKSAAAHYKQYQTWQKQRNEERASLEADYGYDTKHGAHLVRLLRMAVEIVTDGEVIVWRGDRDAEELLAIRGGAWSYDRMMDEVSTMESAVKAAAPNSPLPDQPDRDGLEAMVVGWIEAASHKP